MNRTHDQKRISTVDRTHPFTGIPSTTNLQKRNSDSRSTVSNFSTNQYEVAAQSIMPVLLSIKEQNELFASQKQKIGKEMKVLEDLTQQILTENQVLRLHYIQRSNDLQSLVKTFTINTQEELSQTKHLQHFYREHNCLIAKQIEQITAQFLQREQAVNKLGSDLNMLTEGNVDGCDNLRNRQVKNKMISRNVQKLQTDKLLSRIEQLEEEVCNLQVDNSLLKKKNYVTLQYIKGQKMAINYERPEVTTNAIQAIKSAKLLKQEMDTLESTFDQLCLQRDEKVKNNESLLLKYQNHFANSEAKNRKLKNLQQQKKNYEEECMKMKVSIQGNKKEGDKKQSQKAKLMKQIKNKKEEMEEISKAHEKKRNSLREDTCNKISSIKEKIREKQMELNRILIKELNPEKSESESLIECLKKEVDSLEEEAEQIKSKLNELPNPLREIMRIQMEINALKSRK